MANPENKQIPYESTQQDIRDAIESVATAIGGIAIPSADHVSYDNSGSGLSATDVQNALDEIVGDIPTVNDGTLTIQQNGVTKASFSANTASNVTADIETPTADKKTATSEFSTADGGLLSKCVIGLVPVQSGSGDPSPDNVRPISGHTEVDLQRDGANQWNETYFITGSKIKSYPIPVKENTEYRYINGSGYYASIDVVLSDGTYISFIGNIQSNTTFTTPLGCEYIAFTLTIDYGTTYKNDIAINYPSTITKYEPYLGHLYTINLGGTYYGGYLDLVSGVMIATHALIDYDGSEDESWWKNSTSGYRITISDCKDESFANSDCITNEFTRGESAYDNLKCGITHKYFTIGDTNSTKWADVTALKTWLSSNPLQVVYELATPQTIQLTPQQIETLAGQNNLSTPLSGQSIETNGVEYKELFTFADVKSYVDKKIPDAPTTDGTYTLQAVVSGGVPTYSWV